MTQDNASPIANDTLPPPERAVMCSKCMYWKERPEDAPVNGVSVGTCHVNPPVVTTALSSTGDIRVLSSFPTVPADEWCSRFDDGEDDEDDEDEDDELDDKPTYQELCEMVTALLESTGSAVAKLDLISGILADQSAKSKGKSRLIFHKITPHEREVYNYLKQRMLDREGQRQAMAEELAEEEASIMNGEEEPGMLDQQDLFDAEALDALKRAVDKMDK